MHRGIERGVLGSGVAIGRDDVVKEDQRMSSGVRDLCSGASRVCVRLMLLPRVLSCQVDILDLYSSKLFLF